MDVSSVYRQPTQPTQATSLASETSNAQRRAAQRDDPEVSKAAQDKTPPPKPAPVVNSQGQTTGRIVNTTA
jgi:hypothetical protein